MAANKSKQLRGGQLRPYFLSVMSISLILFMVGMTGVLVVNAGAVANRFKESITVSAVLNVEADEVDASELAESIEGGEYVRDVRIITKEEGVDEMKRILGDDFMDVFEVNPIPVSVEIQVAAGYISTDSLRMIEDELYGFPVVEDVVYQQSLVELLNANIERIGVVCGIFVILLLFISVVLINNMVRLNVYLRNEEIVVKRLTGATRGFIARPFVSLAFFQGLIAGCVADVLILCSLYLVRNEFYQLFALFDVRLLGAVLLAVIALGIMICIFSTSFSVRNLIPRKYTTK